MSNPWTSLSLDSPSSSTAKFGAMGSISQMASELGYEQAIDQDQHLFSVPSKADAFYEVLEQLHEARTQVSQLSDELQLLQQANATADVVSIRSLEDKQQLIQSLDKHLTHIQEERSKLLARLQRPYADDSVVVESEFHETFVSLFKQMSVTISGLPQFLTLVEDMKQFNVDNTDLEEALQSIPLHVARLQRFYDALTRVRALMRQVHEESVLKRS